MTRRERVDVLAILRSPELTKIAAPMVRYSKLPFRLLCRKYNTDIAFTPMILSDSYHRSAKARDLEFQRCGKDAPVVIQFAARNAWEFGRAAVMAAPWVDAIDINCGCPQPWALQEGIGAGLLASPQLIKDMIGEAGALIGDRTLPISVKIRLSENGLGETIDLVRHLQSAGAAWVTVHGRTKKQKHSDPVDYEAIRIIKQSLDIPVIANGDVFTLKQAEQIHQECNVDGVMAARGLLENPTMFTGMYEHTPWSCVDDFVRLSIAYGSTSQVFHHHLVKMCDGLLQGDEYKQLTSLSNASIPFILKTLDALRS